MRRLLLLPLFTQALPASAQQTFTLDASLFDAMGQPVTGTESVQLGLHDAYPSPPFWTRTQDHEFVQGRVTIDVPGDGTELDAARLAEGLWVSLQVEWHEVGMWIDVSHAAECLQTGPFYAFVPDRDGDGHGGRAASVSAAYTLGWPEIALTCTPQAPPDFGPATDCDDDEPDVHPDAVEVCDARDNNCDGRRDEGCSNGWDTGWDTAWRGGCLDTGYGWGGGGGGGTSGCAPSGGGTAPSGSNQADAWDDWREWTVYDDDSEEPTRPGFLDLLLPQFECGCNSGRGPVGAFAVLAPLVLMRRRRAAVRR